MQILIFGDSIVYGSWDTEKGGWVNRLREYLEDKMLAYPSLYYLTYNLGISGDTSTELLSRFKSETEARLKEEGEKLFIFAIGTNDATFVPSQNDFKSRGIDNFKTNLSELLKQAQQFPAKIVFVGFVPIDESKTTPFEWNPDRVLTTENLNKYQGALKSFCAENNIPFIDVYENFIKEDYKNLLDDGLHPNSSGHQKIFEIVRDYLTANKFI